MNRHSKARHSVDCGHEITREGLLNFLNSLNVPRTIVKFQLFNFSSMTFSKKNICSLSSASNSLVRCDHQCDKFYSSSIKFLLIIQFVLVHKITQFDALRCVLKIFKINKKMAENLKMKNFSSIFCLQIKNNFLERLLELLIP